MGKIVLVMVITCHDYSGAHSFLGVGSFGTLRPSEVARTACHRRQVYRTVVSGLVDNVLKGINACVLCYGPTGAGKTCTRLSEPRSGETGARLWGSRKDISSGGT